MKKIIEATAAFFAFLGWLIEATTSGSTRDKEDCDEAIESE